MPPSVLSAESCVIKDEGSIGEVRQQVRMLANRYEFDSFAVVAIVTAASELARNIWHHARHGEVLMEAIEEAGRPGLRLTFIDSGPGINNVDAVLRGRYSSTHSLGLGISGSKRLVDQFGIDTGPGGTRIRLTKWKRLS